MSTVGKSILLVDDDQEIRELLDTYLSRAGFAESFADKGCMSDYFKGIPVWVVTAEFSGLLGAGVALQQAQA